MLVTGRRVSEPSGHVAVNIRYRFFMGCIDRVLIGIWFLELYTIWIRDIEIRYQLDTTVKMGVLIGHGL